MMKKTVPDEQRIQTILDLICALDGRIMKVERDGNTLIVYANIQSYEDADKPAVTDADTDDYTDYAECYQTCENYKAVSMGDWRCVNFYTRCQSCMRDAA